MKLFLLSSSYIEDTLCGIFKNIETLIMLKDNHIHGFEVSVGYEIKLFEKIDDAIEASDLILIIQDKEIPIFLNIQTKLCYRSGKKVVVLYTNASNTAGLSLKNEIQYNKPTILLLESGKYAQLEKTEFEINHQFSSHEIKPYHRLSFLSHAIITCNDIKDYISFDSVRQEDSDVQIISIPRFDKISIVQSSNYAELIQYLMPDIVIVCAESENFNMENCTQILKYRYGINHYHIVFSNYFDCQDHYVKKIHYLTNQQKHDLKQQTNFYFLLLKSIVEEPEGIRIL